MSPYEKCPVFENENYLIRFVQMTDASDLYLVYSDEKAVPIFNSDNCTNEFYCKTVKQMHQMIEFWQREYQNKYYVRWTIWDKAISQAVGTIELFSRKAEDYFNDCGLLRLDLRSDYEYEDRITAILELILTPAWDLFQCKMIATKVPTFAAERKNAVEKLGFQMSNEVLVGSHSGVIYTNYFVINR